MKVTKAQSQENRARIVETASTLFRERGYDGVSVADLMMAAGLTHGGFYKHFGSKADLMSEAAACGISQSVNKNQVVDIHDFINRYLSRAHRDGRSQGCTMAALCGDAARQSTAIKSTFAAGIESMLTAIEQEELISDNAGQGAVRAKTIDFFAHMLGALVLSRACPDDSQLADEILDVCRTRMLASLSLEE